MSVWSFPSMHIYIFLLYMYAQNMDTHSIISPSSIPLDDRYSEALLLCSTLTRLLEADGPVGGKVLVDGVMSI